MRKHILAIDDEAAICRTLETVLTMDGHRVSTATTAEEAHRIIRSDPPDLIIVDLQLGDTDGLVLVEEIRKTMPDVMVLLLTGIIFDPEVTQKTIGRKVSGYLAKPSSLSDICKEVRRLLGTSAPAA